ncbi:hypothetical protein FB567DRAFT_609549 [Paraphoma chrysanthemicola]|uniref:Uncharacterized protein n=1 Tax=Paraphoma chrysanthemicola TaxID=798071 RepID=A0A8K0REZ0_9PLEO|nr:hypothetical protein FB567DRAFT_609549 [Paraphoma chrysanthemicola]
MLHLFYNAAVFQVLTSNENNIFTLGYKSEKWSELNSISSAEVRRINDSSWFDIYNTKYVSGHGDLYLVLDRFAFDPTQNITAVSFTDYLSIEIANGNRSNIASIADGPLPWISCEPLLQLNRSNNLHNKIWPENARVTHSFSNVLVRESAIQISRDFLLVVIAFNFLKVAIMLWVLFTDQSEYLVTLGDAASSFLECPDPSTRGQCMLEKGQHLFNLGHRADLDPQVGSYKTFHDRALGIWYPDRLRYSATLPEDRQHFFAIVLIAIGAANFTFPLGNHGVSAWGTASGDTMPFTGGVLFIAWIVNSPQVLLSFCYLALNNICTLMASAEEWNDIANNRKGLRVSRPFGEQRSIYFLQLPYRYAMPLVVTSSVLHWLLSQSFFLVRVEIFERNTAVANDMSKSACGFFSFSLLISFNVALMLLSVIAWIGSRQMQQRLPAAASCSLVISAACHPPKDEVDIHLKQVKWGLVEQASVDGIGHCSLSANPVRKPEVGKIYR